MLRLAPRLRAARRALAARPLSALTEDFEVQEAATIFSPTAEHGQLREMVRRFAEEEVAPQAAGYNRREELNLPLLRKVGDLGLLGVTVDEAFGGSGMDATAAVIVHEELAAADPAFTLSYLAHAMLFANNLNQNGSDEQRLRYLPGASDGSLIGGMGMSEAGAGTDVLAMSTTARRAPGGYVLNGAKMWITNGTLDGETTGDAFLVYAKTGSSGRGMRDISLFLVDKGCEGFRLGQQIKDKLGMRASPTAELHFADCFVPEGNLVGEEGGAALCMMRNLEIERVTLAAMSLGIARRCIEAMVSYGEQREAFGSPIGAFGQYQKAVAESYAEYMAGRAYVYNTARHLDLGSLGNGLDADGVKLFCADMGTRVADRAIQCLGGYGYVGEGVVERLFRDARLISIGGGTNEAHHKNMARDLRRMDRLP